VLHQSGAAQIDAVRAAYARAGVEADADGPSSTTWRRLWPLRPDDLPRRRQHRHRAVRRRRAQPVGAASRQRWTTTRRDNANFLAGHGAALAHDQQTLTPASLAQCCRH
jgi:hypothetical protein